MNLNVLNAIFKRNFTSYFSSPIGYVFICVFVMLSSLATFWPAEFFSNNLANLDQLSYFLPLILLIFIPAITMSLWADERRQGTDELLLTIPASDSEVVLGKYLAAVSIFTVSLLFSAFSIYLVFLYGLGTPDLGLFLGTYIGYWFVGIAMLGIGMVASFLTSNLTIAFILGVIFNAPLALSGWTDLIIKDPTRATTLSQWSAAERFRDFERGVISLNGMTYFTLLALVAVYLSVVLLGRRHWQGGTDGNSMLGHFLVRVVCLVMIAVGATIFFSYNDLVRADITLEQLNSLTGSTLQIVEEIRENDDVGVVKVDAYISPHVPSEYVETKLNLLSTLDELASKSGGKIQVTRHVVESYSKEAALAEESFGITPREVEQRTRGERRSEEIFLGVAFRSGTNKVVVPFLDRGIPIEYELARSIATVADQAKKTIGVLKTDVQLMGGFSMQGPQEESRLITELKKQFNVLEVDPAQPIEGAKYDVLLAIQPSSLDPTGMDNFVDVIKTGMPVAIFEDPFPYIYGNVVGTTEPKRPPGGMMGMMGMQQPPQPKGDISQLWRVLGVELLDGGGSLVWQRYNPYRKVNFIEPEWIFVAEGNGASNPFHPESEISKGLDEVLFIYAGAWNERRGSKMEVTNLAVTGLNSGTTPVFQVRQSLSPNPFGPRRTPQRVVDPKMFPIAVHVQGKVPPDDVSLAEVEAELEGGEDAGETEVVAEEEIDLEGNPNDQPDINAVLVADIDWIHPQIFQLREMGENEDLYVQWNFQNVTFVLNILDMLADEDRFMEIRRRERSHQILTGIEAKTEDFRKEAIEAEDQATEDMEEKIAEINRQVEDQVKEVRDNPNLDERTKQQYLRVIERQARERAEADIAKIRRQQQEDLKRIDRDLSLQVRSVQDRYKLFALLLPPIPPLLVAFMVFFHRRSTEQEGVAKSRMR